MKQPAVRGLLFVLNASSKAFSEWRSKVRFQRKIVIHVIAVFFTLQEKTCYIKARKLLLQGKNTP